MDDLNGMETTNEIAVETSKISNKYILNKSNPISKESTVQHSSQDGDLQCRNPIEFRNSFWKNNLAIPSWVDIDHVGLDQFFTTPEIAKYCYRSFCEFISKDGKDPNSYKFIEPSAGMGSFYDLLPQNRRLGIDVDPFNSEYIRSDFLEWQPKKNGYDYVCVGNPPFGYRAWLALAFLNHAAKFSDYVGFILPMSFQSRGKSNVQDRVKNLNLVHSEKLPDNSFIDINGRPLKVNALWQIWSKTGTGINNSPKTCNQFIDLFTVDQRKERLCGKARIHEADFFLQRTFYTLPPKLVTSFDQVKYVCGYGIVIKKEKKKVLNVLNNTDWTYHSNLASHNCRHISMCHIRAALTEGGLVDD